MSDIYIAYVIALNYYNEFAKQKTKQYSGKCNNLFINKYTIYKLTTNVQILLVFGIFNWSKGIIFSLEIFV